MKKTVLTLGLLTMGLMATDFSSMTTEELIDLRGTIAVEDQSDYRTEMLSRIDTMSSDELTALRTSRQAVSQGRGGSAMMTQPKLADFDADGDGEISEAEFETAQADRVAQNSADGRLLANADNALDFDTLDTNSDGVISATEFQAHQIEQMESRINQMGQGQGMGQQLRDGSGAGSMNHAQGRSSHGQGGQGMGRNR